MLWLGVYVNLFITVWAYLRHQLTLGATLSALCLGFITLFLGHELFFILLMVFYISSMSVRKLVIKAFPLHFDGMLHKHAKHESRNVIQVLCNGGLLALLSVAYACFPSPLLVYAASVSMAAATADTWASELGALSHEQPHSLFSKKKFPKGASGGVTRLGLWASLAGSALVTLVTSLYILNSFGLSWLWFLISLSMILFGFMGSIVDSLLGEYMQAKYVNDQHELVEHKPSLTSQLVSGYAWIDNNLVNFLSNLIVVSLYFGLLYLL